MHWLDTTLLAALSLGAVLGFVSGLFWQMARIVSFLAAVAATRQPGVSAADYVRRSITSPDSFTVSGFPAEGMGSMPVLALGPEEIEALTAYLLTPADR